jgi:hypothetical protein
LSITIAFVHALVDEDDVAVAFVHKDDKMNFVRHADEFSTTYGKTTHTAASSMVPIDV